MHQITENLADSNNEGPIVVQVCLYYKIKIAVIKTQIGIKFYHQIEKIFYGGGLLKMAVILNLF